MRLLILIAAIAVSTLSFGQLFQSGSTNSPSPPNQTRVPYGSSDGTFATTVGDPISLFAKTTAINPSFRYWPSPAEFYSSDGNTDLSGFATATETLGREVEYTINTPGYYDLSVDNDYVHRAFTVYPDLSTPDMLIDLDTLTGTVDLSTVPQGGVVHIFGTYTGLRINFNNAAGSTSNFADRIFITNAPGQIAKIEATETEWGVIVRDCSGLSIVGNATGLKHGIEIDGPGINSSGINTDIEFSGLRITNAAEMGIIFKNDGQSQSDGLATRMFWNTHVHDCYITDANNEGIYLGRFDYNWAGTSYPTAPYGHDNPGASTWRNRVENCGWDGIQVSSVGNRLGAYVGDNLILNCGRDNQSAQNNGLSLNSGFTGYITRNTVIMATGGNGGSAMQLIPYAACFITQNFFYSPGLREAVFVKTVPNYCPPSGTTPPDCYEHTTADAATLFSNNVFSSTGESIYFLADNATRNGYTPNTRIDLTSIDLLQNTFQSPGLFRLVGYSSTTPNETNNVQF